MRPPPPPPTVGYKKTKNGTFWIQKSCSSQACHLLDHLSLFSTITNQQRDELTRQEFRKLKGNTGLFCMRLLQLLYLVLWCAVYSTLHMYLESSTANFWVLCLCISLLSIILTAAIILIFHYSNKEVGCHMTDQGLMTSLSLSC